MKNIFKLLLILAISFSSCDDDDNRIFEKTADERAAEAIATLKADLIAPSQGWRVKYRPVDEAGAFYVLLNFFDDNTVRIQTDLPADDLAYTNQVISYRVDNSLGLELVFENYSFFHYLFEQDQATFGAEYEFDFVNKTPDNALVFTSKSDFGNPTTILFEEASTADSNLLGVTLGENLETISNDFDLFSSSIKIELTDNDLILYGGLDVSKRIMSFSGATSKSNPQNVQFLDFESGYILQGNSIIFDSPLSGTFAGIPLTVSSVALNTLTEESLMVCADPTPIHAYSGTLSSGESISLESTIINAGGASFTQSTIYGAPLENIRNNGTFVVDEIQADLKGAVQMALLYGLSYQGEIIYGIGFVLVNDDGSVTYALKEFTPTLNGNNLIFDFKPGYKLLLDQSPNADLTKMDKYIDALAEGGQTFAYKYADGVYEFNNPCSGWTVAFIDSE
jgi:hypothetical protein